MARFDVYRNPGQQSEQTPYLLDVQTDLLHGLETRIVIPLRRCDRFQTVKLPGNLSPTFNIENIECILETAKLAAVPIRILKAPVTSLAARRLEITTALDFLFQGF